ncbi:hypothetical protein COCOBI_10-0550 [Coccomyxa sp. Obi]|nr:hypothetical protein COCOBI_10-0550 [Coccomyxa sp. Obi]
MKPCYRHEDNLYLVAHIIREGDQFAQPCKALISPGPTVTRATGEFLQRCGWQADSSKQDGELADVDIAGPPEGTAQLVHCRLLVGNCQLNTVLQDVENVFSSEDCLLSNWHIHIGSEDYETLQRKAWDSDVCYLSASPELGQLGRLPDCPLNCDSFLTAIENGHLDCLSYRHTEIMHHQTEEDDLDPLYLAAELTTADALVYAHDVLGLGWDTFVCAVAAGSGSIECLSYAHASGCPWNSQICAVAASSGSLDCLAYAHEHGSEWDASVLHHAARNGHLECLKE